MWCGVCVCICLTLFLRQNSRLIEYSHTHKPTANSSTETYRKTRTQHVLLFSAKQGLPHGLPTPVPCHRAKDKRWTRQREWEQEHDTHRTPSHHVNIGRKRRSLQASLPTPSADRASEGSVACLQRRVVRVWRTTTRKTSLRLSCKLLCTQEKNRLHASEFVTAVFSAGGCGLINRLTAIIG